MSLEILMPAAVSQLAGGSLIGDRDIERLNLMCLSSKPLSITCRSSSAK